MDCVRTTCLLGILVAVACGAPDAHGKRTDVATAPDTHGPRGRHLVLIGTNDVHGHIGRLSLLSGYLGCIETRNPHAEVMFVDAGDLFQGTLESNLNEGQSVIEVFNALGLTAAAVGNHEFDFGPIGEEATASSESDDPRGALKARMEEAEFPFLSANLQHEATGELPAWPNFRSSLLVDAGGFRIGLVGLATRETLRTTISANVRGLTVEDPATALLREADAVRKAGADIIVGLGHLGGRCSKFDDPKDLSSCEADEELFQVLRSLPPGSVDAFVGGHTHQRVAHIINGTVAIESGARASHFGRIDIVERDGERSITPMPPETICPDAVSCTYQGCNVRAHLRPDIQAITDRYLTHAQQKRDVDLGVSAEDLFEQIQDDQSALGNLLADLILDTHPDADLAIMNGGGIRAPLHKGPIRYGDFFEIFPFDNRFAMVQMTGAAIEKLFLNELLRGHHSVLSIAGMTVAASCQKGRPHVEVRTANGKPLRPKKVYRIVTSDFLATGGDGAFVDADIEIERGPLMRDAMVGALQRRNQPLRAGDPRLTTQRYPKRNVFSDCPESQR